MLPFSSILSSLNVDNVRARFVGRIFDESNSFVTFFSLKTNILICCKVCERLCCFVVIALFNYLFVVEMGLHVLDSSRLEVALGCRKRYICFS